MFTPEEQPLLLGTDDAIMDFVDCDRCMVVDWRGSVEEAIEFRSQYPQRYQHILSDLSVLNELWGLED